MFLLILKQCQCRNVPCILSVREALTFECLKNSIDTFGFVNFVFAYKFLGGYENNFTTKTSLWKFKNSNMIYREPILIIELKAFPNKFI